MQLAENEVHLWLIDLDHAGSEAKWKDVLAPDELERAERFHFEHDRSRYLAAHGVLRVLLAMHTSLAPKEINFDLNPFGKPSLAAGTLTGSLEFNLSHSAELAVIGLARRGRLGVDIEKIRPDAANAAVAQKAFSRAECEVWRMLPKEQQTEAFFNCWTRREAVLKALGCGFSGEIELEVELAPGKPAMIHRLEGKPAANWRLIHFQKPSFIGAVAIENPRATLVEKRWDPSAV